MDTCALRAASRALRIVLALAALATVAQDARAADPQTLRLTDLTLEQLADIEVTTVSKKPEEIWRTAVAVYVITRQDIVRSGANSIPEVLRLAPGIEVARIDSDHWAVGVRGFGDQFSKALLVLIDGRSIYTPLFAGMYWPAHDTLLDDVDRIEVIRGTGGTIWGANAVSGVINIITRSAADTHGVLASASTGNILQGSGALRYGAGRGRTFNYRVYGKATRRGPEYHSDGSDFDRWWTTQAGARADWTRPRDTVTLQGDVSRGSDGQRVNVATYAPPFQQTLDGPLAASGANVIARWQHDATATRGFHLQAYYDRTSWLAPHFGEQRNTFDVDFVQHATVGGRHAVTAGAGARLSPSTFTQTVPTIDFIPHEDTDRTVSAFAQDEIDVVRDRLLLTAGLKVEHDTHTDVEYEPDARILWRITPRQSLWSAVTRAIRTPSRIEENVDTTTFSSMLGNVPVFLRVGGNPDFQPERVVGYESGYRAQLAPNASVDVAAFHDHHDGLSSFGLGAITVEPTPAPLHAVVNVFYVNGVGGSSNGGEISPEWRLKPWVDLKGSYSYVQLVLHTAPGSADANAVARYVGSSPRHQLRAQADIELRNGVGLNVAYRFASALPVMKVARYHTADARLAWRMTPKASVSIAGRDLLTPRHVEFGHNGPPVAIARSVTASITWQPDTHP